MEILEKNREGTGRGGGGERGKDPNSDFEPGPSNASTNLRKTKIRPEFPAVQFSYLELILTKVTYHSCLDKPAGPVPKQSTRIALY